MWWLACTGPEPRPRPGEPDSGAHSAELESAPVVHSATPRSTGTPTHSATTVPFTGDTGPDPCALAPPPPGQEVFVQVSVSSEEFAFDAAGNWYGVVEGQGLFRQTLGGAPELRIPYASAEAAGLRFHPDGNTLALADESAGLIALFDLAAGTVTTGLAGLPSPNSITYDAAGDLWVGSYGRLLRLRAGEVTPEVIADLPYTDLDGLTMSPDDQRLWFNGDETGDVWAVDLDPARDVVSVEVQFTVPLYYTQLDGMTTDTCGNLYLLFTDGRLWRHRLDGSLEELLGSQFSYASAVGFGSGLGGWQRDVLYVQDRGSGLYGVPIGLEGRPEPHLP